MSDYVAEATGVDADGWFRIVEDLIAANTTYPGNGGPGTTQFGAVWEGLLLAVMGRASAAGRGDGNIFYFHLVGRIALRWSQRILEWKSTSSRYTAQEQMTMSNIAASFRDEIVSDFAPALDPRTESDMTDLYGTEWDNMPAERACAQADFDDYCAETMRDQMESDYWSNYNRAWDPYR